MSSRTRSLGIKRHPSPGPFKPEFLVGEAVASASSLGEMSSLLSRYAKVLEDLAADGWELDDRRGDGDSLYLVDAGGFGTRESWALELDRTSAWLRQQRVEGENRRRREFEALIEAADPPGERVSERLAASTGVEWLVDRNPELDPQKVSAGSRKAAWWRGIECGHVYEWEIREQCALLLPRTVWSRTASVCRVCLGAAKQTEQAERDRLKTFKTARLVDYWPTAAEWWHRERNDTAPEEHLAADSTPVWWLHPVCGHPYEEPVRRFSPNSTECLACRDRQVLPGFNDLLTRYPALAGRVTESANPGVDLSALPAWGARQIGWECEGCGTVHEDTAYRLTRTPVPSCRSCSLTGTSAVEIALRDALSARATVDPGEVALAVAWGSRSVSRVDIAGTTEDGVRFVVEYDGQRWHAAKTDQDRAKTVALLDAGYIVVRVRENTLPHLPIADPSLAQVTHRYGAEIELLADTVLAEIMRLQEHRATGAASAV